MSDRPEPPEAPDGPVGPAGRAKAELPPTGCAPSLDELYRYIWTAPSTAAVEGTSSPISTPAAGCGELYDVQAQFLKLIEVRCKSELPPDLPDRVFGAIAELGLPPKRSLDPGRSSPVSVTRSVTGAVTAGAHRPPTLWP